MFAPAKTGYPVKHRFIQKVVLKVVREVRKYFSKKLSKSIVSDKKGFYICTRLTRKRVKKR